jgi:hypothetical protein
MKAATLTVLAMLSAVPMVGIAAQPRQSYSLRCEEQYRSAYPRIEDPQKVAFEEISELQVFKPPNIDNPSERKKHALTENQIVSSSFGHLDSN